MWLLCEIANDYYGNGKRNKSLVLLEWGNDGGGEMRPKPFLGYYPQLTVSLTPRLSHFLWSPPVSFVFSLLRLSSIILSPAFPSLSLSVSLSVYRSVLWDRGVRSSWVHQGGKERERGLKCESEEVWEREMRNGWRESEAEGKISKNRREDRDGEEKDVNVRWVINRKEVRLNRSGEWRKPWCKKYDGS